MYSFNLDFQLFFHRTCPFFEKLPSLLLWIIVSLKVCDQKISLDMFDFFFGFRESFSLPCEMPRNRGWVPFFSSIYLFCFMDNCWPDRFWLPLLFSRSHLYIEFAHFYKFKRILWRSSSEWFPRTRPLILFSCKPIGNWRGCLGGGVIEEAFLLV